MVKSYVDELRANATANIHAMTLNAANRQRGAEELRAIVGNDPAISVAFKVCSAAGGDSLAGSEARNRSLIDQRFKIADYVIVHSDATLDDAQAKELTQLFDQLLTTYGGPAPH